MRSRTLVLGVGLALGLLGCAGEPAPTGSSRPTPTASVSSPGERTASPPAATDGPDSEEPETLASNGRPRRALMTIPAIGVRVPVVPYAGWTDDAPGTEIQNRGVAASPHGPRGGIGPGGVGNYQVTAHRTSSTRAFEFLPDVRRGDQVFVDVRTGAGRVRYVYRVVATRETSFRSLASLRAQRAPVPGRPGVEPTRAMITLSTCATPEDHATGNYWADEFDNPEHRIDKIGVLVAVRRR